MDHSTDVLIVGAGPAGLAAAIVFGRNGLRVTVCERSALPRDKACGEGIMPTGVDHLKALGVYRYLDVAEYRELAGIRFHSLAGNVAAARFSEGPGFGVRRTMLSQALLSGARETSRVTVLENVRVGQIQELPDGFEIGVGDRLITPRLVVGADGIRSAVRRWTGLEGPPQRLRRLGGRQHFLIAPWSRFVEVFQGRGIEAYVTPCAADQVGVAFLWDPSVAGTCQSGEQRLPWLLSNFPELRQRLQGVSRCSSFRSSGPLHRVATGRCRAGVLLIGDAGGYLDACTGEGISLALAQALLLESTVVPRLKEHATKPTVQELVGFERACRRISRPYLVGTRFQLFLCRHPRVADRFVRAVSQHEEVMSHYLSATMGTTSFWPGLRAAVGMLQGFWQPSSRSRP